MLKPVCVESVLDHHLPLFKPGVLFFFIALCCVGFTGALSAQTYYQDDKFLRFEDYVYKENIKSVKLTQRNLPLSEPMLPLQPCDRMRTPGTRLILRFDDLDATPKDYYYTIVHCDANWHPSQLNDMEYIDGFVSDRIQTFEFSFNTYVPFVHYSLELPNDQTCFTKSGNYLLIVYSDSPDYPVLTRRFMISENSVKLDARIRRPGDVSKIRTHHEIDFTVNYEGLPANNPRTEFTAVVKQNFRWDNAFTVHEPMHERANRLIYEFQNEIVFPAGKEFRMVDARSFRFRTERVARLEDDSEHFHLHLFPDEIRTNKPYFYEVDINGKYLIDNSLDVPRDGGTSVFDLLRTGVGTRNVRPDQLSGSDMRAQEDLIRRMNLESDYAYVHFSLPVNQPYRDGNIHLFGELTDRALDHRSLMKYDEQVGAYKLSLYLKQGFYNYKYAFVQDGSSMADFSRTEGNWHEAENEYQILIYFRPFGERYDRLVGYRNMRFLPR